MSREEDLFMRIAQQNLGLASVIQPLTAPRFAAGPAMLDEISREIMAEFFPAAFPQSKANEQLHPSPQFPDMKANLSKTADRDSINSVNSVNNQPQKEMEDSKELKDQSFIPLNSGQPDSSAPPLQFTPQHNMKKPTFETRTPTPSSSHKQGDHARQTHQSPSSPPTMPAKSIGPSSHINKTSSVEKNNPEKEIDEVPSPELSITGIIEENGGEVKQAKKQSFSVPSVPSVPSVSSLSPVAETNSRQKKLSPSISEESEPKTNQNTDVRHLFQEKKDRSSGEVASLTEYSSKNTRPAEEKSWNKDKVSGWSNTETKKAIREQAKNQTLSVTTVSSLPSVTKTNTKERETQEDVEFHSQKSVPQEGNQQSVDNPKSSKENNTYNGLAKEKSHARDNSGLNIPSSPAHTKEGEYETNPKEPDISHQVSDSPIKPDSGMNNPFNQPTHSTQPIQLLKDNNSAMEEQGLQPNHLLQSHQFNQPQNFIHSHTPSSAGQPEIERNSNLELEKRGQAKKEINEESALNVKESSSNKKDAVSKPDIPVNNLSSEINQTVQSFKNTTIPKDNIKQLNADNNQLEPEKKGVQEKKQSPSVTSVSSVAKTNSLQEAPSPYSYREPESKTIVEEKRGQEKKEQMTQEEQVISKPPQSSYHRINRNNLGNASSTSSSGSLRINIGRIKIKTPEKPAPVRKFKRPSPSLSLHDYLQLRKNRGRRP